VAHETFEEREFAVLNLVQRAVAIRAANRDLITSRFACRMNRSLLAVHISSFVSWFSDVGGFAVHQLHKHVGNLANWQAKIDIDHFERAPRHVGCKRFVWVLHNGHAAARFDEIKTSCAVIASAAQHNADNFRAMFARSAAKQNIDRGTMTVFTRAARENSHSILDRQMMLRRGNVNAAAFIRLLCVAVTAGSLPL